MVPENYVQVSEDMDKRLSSDNPRLARKFGSHVYGGPARCAAWLCAMGAVIFGSLSGAAAVHGGRSAPAFSGAMAAVAVTWVFRLALCHRTNQAQEVVTSTTYQAPAPTRGQALFNLSGF